MLNCQLLEVMVDNQEVEKNILSLVVDSLTGNTPLMYAVMENKVTLANAVEYFLEIATHSRMTHGGK